ncbi:MAG: GDSL-type esterase/lipase family protein [Ginsengibacter sp.]
MNKLMKYCYSVLFFLASFLGTYAQQHPPFYSDIKSFEKQDSIHFPPSNEILFVGSSSFTKWTDVQDYFPSYPIVNRGFGGSSLPDVIRYADEIIFPYHPKQIVIYCGENDLAASDTVTAQIVFARFKVLFEMIRKKLPNVPIDFVSMKPSPSRENLMPKYVEGNLLIKKFLQKKKKASFINIYDAMLDKNGKPMKDIFIGDNLHMNAKGYKIWQKIIAPYLIK